MPRTTLASATTNGHCLVLIGVALMCVSDTHCR
ncbi:hypothetical protein ABH932_003216 [Streptacidiphilus sp. MAP5-52]